MTDDLPYINSKTKPHLAKERIQRTLEKFGVDQITLSENFKTHEIRLSFIYENIPVSIPIDYCSLGRLYNRMSPWADIDETKQKQAKNAAYAAMEDYLKAMLTMHKMGVMTLTEIFMPNLVGKNGIRLAEMVENHLPDFLEGKLLKE